MAYKGNLMDYLNMQVRIAKMGDVTKEDFGKFMHDDGKTHEEKMKFLKKVEEAGGYDALL